MKTTEHSRTLAGAAGSARQKLNWLDVALAYEEAAEHLERCATQSEDSDERAAMRIVAKRIRISGLCAKPNDTEVTRGA
jgi:hypothetical protein